MPQQIPTEETHPVGTIIDWVQAGDALFSQIIRSKIVEYHTATEEELKQVPEEALALLQSFLSEDGSVSLIALLAGEEGMVLPCAAIDVVTTNPDE